MTYHADDAQPLRSLLNSGFAVVAIWAAHQFEATLAGIDLNQEQNGFLGVWERVFNQCQCYFLQATSPCVVAYS